MIRRGAWHQFGDRSQKQVLDQLEHGAGVGVVVSPRDLAFNNAEEYCQKYRDLGASVLYDHQIYVPGFSNAKLISYPGNEVRESVSTLKNLTSTGINLLSKAIEEINSRLGTVAVLAPAVVYEANRPDILELNGQLFAAASKAAKSLGRPVMATIVLGQSVTVSPGEISSVLAHATGLDADGWYFAYEFSEDRIPRDRGNIVRCGDACLTLAATGKPVFHAYAGPMALLSLGFGASAAGIGHSQTLWQFNRNRFAPAAGNGGGGDAPPRFFSTALWGTVVCPDELATIPAEFLDEILTTTEFSSVLSPTTFQTADWSRWEAGKHLVMAICQAVQSIADASTVSVDCARFAETVLNDANNLFGRMGAKSVVLREESRNLHQPEWLAALGKLQASRGDDYEFLELLAS